MKEMKVPTERGVLLDGVVFDAPTASGAQNELVFIERTGHTYQMEEQEVVDTLREMVTRWRAAA